VTPAKRRSSGANPPKKANPVAPTSRTTPKGTPKGRVPVAAADSRSARRAKTSDDRARTADDKGRRGGAKAETPVVVDAEGVPVAKPRYGAGALILAFLAGQLLSTAAYVVVQSVSNYDFAIPAGVGAAVGQASAQVSTGHALAISVPPPLWVTALMQLPLWLGIGLIPVWFAVNRGKGVVADLGLRMKAIDVPIGLAIGVASQLVMVPVLYWLLFKVIGVKDVSAAARSLTDRATDPLSIVLVFVVVAMGAPIAEEIYFRGFAQRIFGRRIRPHWAILASATFFAASHMQVLQFPALLVFGLILGVLAWRSGRLGPAIWAHVGFNAVTAATLVFHLG
jgi:membrane protease YdiL (CAAX protease family)